MKTKLIKSKSRGYANHGWLKTNHSFSFADYYNPDRINFGALRVLNDDVIAPADGFGMHPHSDMEIITFPLSGMLEHKDSIGNKGTLKSGEVQVMTAGSGIRHSEFNASKTEDLSLLQIWIFTNKVGLTPDYKQKDFSQNFNANDLTLIVSGDGEDQSLKINQDAWIWRGKLLKNKILQYTFKGKNHGVYLFLISGSLRITDNYLEDRDAIEIHDNSNFEMLATESCEFLIIEVPMADWAKT